MDGFREIISVAAPEVLGNLVLPVAPDAALIQEVMDVAALKDEAEGEVTPYSPRTRGANIPLGELMGQRVADVSRASRRPTTLGLRTQGAAVEEEELTVTEVAEMSEQDLAGLVKAKNSAPQGSIPTVSVAHLRQQHHAIARLLATGVGDSEVATICGVAPSTVSNLKRSPAFQNIVLGYQKMIDAEATDLGIDIRLAAARAVATVSDYVSQPLANIDPEVLKEMTFGLLDRAGHSPVAKSVVATAAMSRSDLDQLKSAAAVGKFEVVDAIDLQPIDSPPVEAGSPQGDRPAAGNDGGAGPVP